MGRGVHLRNWGCADIIDESPASLQLRYLQTLNTISAENNHTYVFPCRLTYSCASLLNSPSSSGDCVTVVDWLCLQLTRADCKCRTHCVFVKWILVWLYVKLFFWRAPVNHLPYELTQQGYGHSSEVTDTKRRLDDEGNVLSEADLTDILERSQRAH